MKTASHTSKARLRFSDGQWLPVAEMHPEQIKAELRMRGVTPAAIAAELGVAHSSISQVISGRAESSRIKDRIAQVIGMPVAKIWPPIARPRLRRTGAEIRRPRATA